MACKRCGCRLVAKSSLSTGGLICVECGHPADAKAYQEQARSSRQATLALVVFAVLSALVLTFAVLLDLRQTNPEPEPTASGKLEG